MSRPLQNQFQLAIPRRLSVAVVTLVTLSLVLSEQAAWGQAPPETVKPKSIEPTGSARPLNEPMKPMGVIQQADGQISDQERVHLKISGLLEQLASETGLTGDAARRWISDHVGALLHASQPSKLPAHLSSVTMADGTAVPLLLDEKGCGFAVHGEELVVTSASPVAVSLVRNSLQRIAQTGVRQVFLRVRVLRAEQAAIQDLGLRWSHVETVSQIAQDTRPDVVTASAVQDVAPRSLVAMRTQAGLRSSLESKNQLAARAKLEPSQTHTEKNWIEASSIVERATPVLYTLLSPTELNELMAAVRNNEDISIVNAPSVSVFNGNSATINSLTERPLVTSVSVQRTGKGDHEQVHFVPKTRVYPQGSSLMLLPRLIGGDRIRLNCLAEQFTIRSIETLELPVGDRQVMVQLPEIAKTQFRSQMEVPLGYAMAISMTDTDETGTPFTTLTLCQCNADTVRGLDSGLTEQ